MKKVIIFALVGLFLATSAIADVYVKGYTRKDGTYVAPHYRSDPNGSVYDNWSTKGNVNPYTGKKGTKNPYSSGSSTFGGGSDTFGGGSIYDNKW